MVQVIEKEVPIADAVRVEVHNGIVRVEGPRGTLERDLWYPSIDIRVEPDKVCVGTTLDKKTQKSIVGTYASHIAEHGPRGDRRISIQVETGILAFSHPSEGSRQSRIDRKFPG